MSLHNQHSPDPASGRSILLGLLAVCCVLGAAAWLAPTPTQAIATTPEPADVETRITCRQWQVTVAASGITTYPDAGGRAAVERRAALLADFLPRVEATAAIEEAEQETFLALVGVIESARELRDAAPADHVARLADLEQAMGLVDETCTPRH